MLYIRLENQVAVEVTTKRIPDMPMAAVYAEDPHDCYLKPNGWICRWDIGNFDFAKKLAAELTAKLGKTYLATDDSPSTSPRYDVIEAPAVGDPVSYAFNGDYTPCGFITKITPTWQVTTSTGKKFRRKQETGNWRMVGGTWSMVGGHISERNPSF